MKDLIQLVAIRLSNNPTKAVIDAVDGIDGKLNETSDGRGYYLAVFKDANNPFAEMRTRMISQQLDSDGNPSWKAGTPSMIAKFVGRTMPGSIVTATVEPYMIGKNEQTVYTTVVLGSETTAQAFKRAGHVLAVDRTEVPFTEEELQDAKE